MSCPKLHCENLIFTANFLEIKIRFSKTDQYWQGDTVLVACTGRPACPVSMVGKRRTSQQSGLLFCLLMSMERNLDPMACLLYFLTVA